MSVLALMFYIPLAVSNDLIILSLCVLHTLSEGYSSSFHFHHDDIDNNINDIYSKVNNDQHNDNSNTILVIIMIRWKT